jgi:hypothetical protein
MSTIAQTESQLKEQPDLQLFALDTTNFLGSESMETASADMLSDIYSVYAEPWRCTECPVRSSWQPVSEYHLLQDQNSKFRADICDLRDAPSRGWEETAAEFANLWREKDTLEQTPADKQRSLETWMAAKVSAKKDVEQFRDENTELRRKMDEMTHPPGSWKQKWPDLELSPVTSLQW